METIPPGGAFHSIPRTLGGSETNARIPDATSMDVCSHGRLFA